MLDNPSEAVRQQLITMVSGWGGLVLGYFFGSSSGSASKDSTIKNIAKVP